MPRLPRRDDRQGLTVSRARREAMGTSKNPTAGWGIAPPGARPGRWWAVEPEIGPRGAGEAPQPGGAVGDDGMNDWRSHFAKRMSALQDTAASRFGAMAEQEVRPAFEDLAAFVTTGGFEAETSHSCSHVRTYRFCLAEGFCVQVVFTLIGPCQAQCAFQIERGGARQGEATVTDTVAINDMTEGWARQQFQRALDAFMEEVERMSGGSLESAAA